ncbi:MAG: hypothetical protein V3S11_00325 [Elusimicrobiota bacterium]
MRTVEVSKVVGKDVRTLWREITQAEFCSRFVNALRTWKIDLDYRIERAKPVAGADSPSLYLGDSVVLSTRRGKEYMRLRVAESVAPQRYSLVIEPTGRFSSYMKTTFQLLDLGDERTEVTVTAVVILQILLLELFSLILPIGWTIRRDLRRLLKELG